MCDVGKEGGEGGGDAGFAVTSPSPFCAIGGYLGEEKKLQQNGAVRTTDKERNDVLVDKSSQRL